MISRLFVKRDDFPRPLSVTPAIFAGESANLGTILTVRRPRARPCNDYSCALKMQILFPFLFISSFLILKSVLLRVHVKIRVYFSCFAEHVSLSFRFWMSPSGVEVLQPRWLIVAVSAARLLAEELMHELPVKHREACSSELCITIIQLG